MEGVYVGVGIMVVLKEDNLPPLRWKLGRITALHPGKDGISIVLSIKTAEGVVQRPATTVCILSMDEGGGDSNGLTETRSSR